MSLRSVLEIAALASAAMPELAVASTRGSEQFIMSGDKKDITTAVVTSIEGMEYDVSVSSSSEGKSVLKDRAKAAYVLTQSKAGVGLSFALEDYTLYIPGDSAQDVTGDNAVYITPHVDGDAVALKNLTSAQCTAAGTAIAGVHRLRPGFLRSARYRAYSAEAIQGQLSHWMTSLESAGHIPSEIIDNWRNIISTDGLWNFTACPVHGGIENGDLLFVSNSVSAIRHWENMQINDPARDLAWIFSHLNKSHRDAFIASYSRMMGSRLDNMIWLRAGLWTQMEQVGEYMRALKNADTAKILAFKSQVNSLAHQIAKNNPQRPSSERRTSLTVGDLLENPSAVQGKAETRARGGNSQKAGHTRFVVDSGQRTTTLQDDATIDRTIQTATKSRDEGSARRNWNSTPVQSESFTFTSPSEVTPVASGEQKAVSDAEAVAESLNSATIAMQEQSAAAAARHAADAQTYTSSAAYSAQKYVRVDSMGFVLDDVSSVEHGVVGASTGTDDATDAVDADDTGDAHVLEHSSSHDVPNTDDVETTVFAAQEHEDSSSTQQVD
ncbi:phosphotransferase [Alloscardovia macacae]|uniref:phosphotransferase n=1 Tax=Alloscardovia macacae TaxID=1160091 RepID=UPI0011D0C7A8|nr:phosphotransferase [Alloscardovia macacae]